MFSGEPGGHLFCPYLFGTVYHGTRHACASFSERRVHSREATEWHVYLFWISGVLTQFCNPTRSGVHRRREVRCPSSLLSMHEKPFTTEILRIPRKFLQTSDPWIFKDIKHVNPRIRISAGLFTAPSFDARLLIRSRLCSSLKHALPRPCLQLCTYTHQRWGLRIIER